ncbi:hypothetical protein [Reyranella soli]|uniref:hypothetical protein n=1 Tax=Reyranella soli TaxID=1230389 RepID=UPI001478AB90|nr:hypothetical protein [Reyranella soli]
MPRVLLLAFVLSAILAFDLLPAATLFSRPRLNGAEDGGLPSVGQFNFEQTGTFSRFGLG